MMKREKERQEMNKNMKSTNKEILDQIQFVYN